MNTWKTMNTKLKIAWAIIILALTPIILGLIALIGFCLYMAVTETPLQAALTLGAIIIYFSICWAYETIKYPSKN